MFLANKVVTICAARESGWKKPDVHAVLDELYALTGCFYVIFCGYSSESDPTIFAGIAVNSRKKDGFWIRFRGLILGDRPFLPSSFILLRQQHR